MTAISNVRIFDLNACKSAVDAAPNPKAKFKIFNELTDEGLDSVTLDVLNYIGNPANSHSLGQTHFPPGTIERTLSNKYLDTIGNSLGLSSHLMQSIGESGQRQLNFVCLRVDTFICNKIFNAMEKIHLSPNSVQICVNRLHPLHVICEQMWPMEHLKHGDECPCNGQTTHMKITHDAGLGDILTIELTIKVKPTFD